MPILLAMALIGNGAYAGEQSLRERLIGTGTVETLYSVDDHTTIVKAADGQALKGLEALCSEYIGAGLVKEGAAMKCGAIFEASEDLTQGKNPLYRIKSEEAQPVAYKIAALPPFEELSAPPDGRIEGGLGSIDVYQYMYALCKKEQGSHSIVISRRFGRFVRLVEVPSEEAFDYLLSSGDTKDPWFFACEGENRFIVEKDYQYDPDGEKKFYFRQDRGLESVDYIKSGEREKLARLERSSKEDPSPDPSVETRMMEAMAVDLSELKFDFIKTGLGAKYEGHYNNTDDAGCARTTIKQTRSGTAEEVFNYRVCGTNVALIDSTDRKSGFFAGLLGK
ncbi:MAG: hypothetical protein A2V21_306960 [Deltaproteobacteria bacterium GWC2_55_46]|nr:MAG: hypothetical protein A2V21_306960 [Deltaproteobacteria bacterium GWC2_55_46]